MQAETIELVEFQNSHFSFPIFETELARHVVSSRQSRAENTLSTSAFVANFLSRSSKLSSLFITKNLYINTLIFCRQNTSVRITKKIVAFSNTFWGFNNIAWGIYGKTFCFSFPHKTETKSCLFLFQKMTKRDFLQHENGCFERKNVSP